MRLMFLYHYCTGLNETEVLKKETAQNALKYNEELHPLFFKTIDLTYTLVELISLSNV
ncbi:hypothetical protein [Flavobacterium sp. ZS1P14]|uniref:hypothetical protein n=1 Tax=Flavobacterium sp. ZS1P14 TaxID=3401729 RepID=UPI003AAA9F2A